MKTCRRCKESKQVAAYYLKAGRPNSSTCIPCTGELKREKWAQDPDFYRRQNRESYRKDPNKYRRYDLKKTYGITVAEYQALFSGQSGRCRICERHQLEFNKALAVDHCHKTGAIRGLLCSACNCALGLLKDDITRARALVAYLQASKEDTR